MSKTRFYIFLALELALFTGGTLLIFYYNWIIAAGMLLIYISVHVGSHAREKIRDKVNDQKIQRAKKEAKFEFYESRIKKALDE